MFKQAFANFTDTHLAVTGFMLFILVFLGVLTWTLFIQKNNYYTKLSELPLEKGKENV